MKDIAEKLKTIGDPTRFRILEFLAAPVSSCCSRDDGVCGCDLEDFLDLTQPTVSHHMKLLTEAGLVTAERRGRWVYYAIDPDAMRAVASALESLASAAERIREELEAA